MKKTITLAIHLGVGYHDNQFHNLYRTLASDSCIKGLELLSSGEEGNLVLTKILSVLENSPLTNAGYNSNLNLEGDLEFDASIMSGLRGVWASVGCIQNVINPIYVANLLLDQQIKAHILKTQLVQPCFLAGSQASKWAFEHGVQFVNSSDMITENGKEEYIKALKKLPSNIHQTNCNASDQIIPLDELGNPAYLESTESQPENTENSPNSPLPINSSPYLNLGTIGAVCSDAQGNFYSAVSSGGSILKTPGRVGHAAMYGSGCWAENGSTLNQNISTATSTSGCGEQLIKVLMAKTTSDHIRSTQNPCEGVTKSLQQFLDAGKDCPTQSARMGGVLSISSFPQDCEDSNSDLTTEIAWGHTCRTFVVCYGYCKPKLDGSYTFSKPKVEFVEQSAKNCGETITTGGKIIRI